MEQYNFNDHGFVILKKVFDGDTLSKMRDLTDRIIQDGEKELEDPFSPYYMRHRTDQGALYDLFQRHPEFQELAKNEVILDEISKVVGEDIFLYENSLVYKPKGKNNEVPWHQDFINRPTEPIKFIAWIALDDVLIDNGAMKVIPGSHKNGFLPWFTVPGETHHTRLKLDGIKLEDYIFAELEAGDVLIFNQLLLHSSDRIVSEKPRRAYRISYQGFEQIFTPRSTPFVLRGGLPESIRQRYNKPYEKPQPAPAPAPQPKKNIVQKVLNKVGKRLQRF
ncbi:phytanoyl-CoA dioxygenase family protein [Mucilaginibacter terrae]|uniref:phytanoyl-CoA dioxygenase family protein n=1 Tax=Mucilaginibacter terrae TaxID=1955052 RepID=UPI003638CCF2